MLVVQLVIYDVYGRKTRTRVGFSEALDLSRFQTDTSGTSLKYKLASVVSHDGASADSGHYIAHVSGPQRTHIISDEDVRKTGAGALTAAVQRSPRGWGMFDPYLLFFTRVG
jgi:ubiquitin C-terminal hydrolase